MSRDRPALIAAAGVVLVFCVAVVLAPPRYAEDYYTNILQNVSFARSVTQGALPTWIPELVIGVPAPLVHSQIFHPGIVLFAVFDFHVAAALYVIAHVVLAAGALLLIGRRLALPPWMAPFGIGAMLFSPALLRSVFETDWISLVTDYTLFIVLVAGFLRLLDPRLERPLPTAIGIGYVAGLMASSGHLGYLVCFGPAILMLIAVNHRALAGRWRELVAASAIAIVLSIGQIYPILYNAELFSDPGGRYFNAVDNFHAGQLFAFLFGTGDFSALSPSLNTMLWRGAFSPWWYTAYGGLFIVLGLPLVFSANRIHRSLALATAASIALMFVPERYAGGLVSASWLFGDAATVTGVLAGMIGATRLAAAGYQRTVTAGLVFQSLMLSVAPLQLIGQNVMARTVAAANRPGYSFDLRRMPDFVEPMQPAKAGDVNRVYYGHRFERAVNSDQGLLRARMLNNTPPLFGIGNLTAYAKGIWLGDVNPPVGPMRNWLYPGDKDLTDKYFFDVMSIDYALLLEGDRMGANLIALDQYGYDWTHERVTLARNPTAWPEGVFVRPDARSASVANGSRCSHHTIYCMDFETVASFRIEGDHAEVTRIGGSYDVRVMPRPERRLLLIPDLFRSGWVANSESERVDVFPMFRGLIGMIVPANAGHIRMRFLPMPAAGFMALSLLATWVLPLVLVASRLRRRRALLNGGGS